MVNNIPDLSITPPDTISFHNFNVIFYPHCMSDMIRDSVELKTQTYRVNDDTKVFEFGRLIHPDSIDTIPISFESHACPITNADVLLRIDNGSTIKFEEDEFKAGF